MARRREPSSKFLKVDRGVMRVLKCSGYIGAVALMIAMVLAVVDVVLAKFFHASIPYATEAIQYLNVAMVFFGIAYVQLDMGHTCVDLLWEHFPRKLRFLIKFVFYILGVGVCGYFGYRAVILLQDKFAKHALAGGSVGFEVWPFVAILAWGFFSLAVANIWSIVRAIVAPGRYVLREKEKEELPEEGEVQ